MNSRTIFIGCEKVKPFCEVVVQDVLPSIRASLAKEMIDSGLNQSEVSKKLGVSQPAISQYLRSLRGSSGMRDQDVKKRIKELATDIKNGKIATQDITTEFCKICKIIQDKKLICSRHKNIYPSLKNCVSCPRC